MKWTLQFFALLFLGADSCTLIIVGPEATADGSAYVAHTDDAGGMASDMRLVKVPARHHAPGSKRPIYQYNNGYPRVVSLDFGKGYMPQEGQSLTTPVGYIDEVPYTYGYIEQEYGMVNDVQLSIAETTTSSRTAAMSVAMGGKALLDIGELTRIALERCDSAVCAIKTMGALAEEHGFYSDDSYSSPTSTPDYIDSGEALGIADKYGEVWTINIVAGPNGGGAIWAAERLAPDVFHVNANDLSVGEIDFADSGKFLYSRNIAEVSTQLGFYNSKRDGKFNFKNTFTVPFGKMQYVWRRQWRLYSLVAPNSGITPETTDFPMGVKPEKKISISDMITMFRDVFEGTPYDLTVGLAARFGSPARYANKANETINGGWERPVSVPRSVYSFVAVVRPWLPDHIGGMVWFGWDWPICATYHPLYSSALEVPTGYDRWGKQSAFEWGSSWRPFNLVSNYVNIRFDHMIVDIRKAQAEWENKGFAVVAAAEKAALQVHDPAAALALLQKATNDHAESLVKAWWELFWTLLAKFNQNAMITGESSDEWTDLGYPTWLLEIMSYAAYPKLLPAPLKSPACQLPENTISLSTETRSDVPFVTLSFTRYQFCVALCTGFAVAFAPAFLVLKVLKRRHDSSSNDYCRL